MSYAGLGTNIMPTVTSAGSQQNTSPLVTRPVAPWLAPTPLTPMPTPGQAALPSWRQQITRMLEAAAVMIVSLPGEVLSQLMSLLDSVGPVVRQEWEEFTRTLSDPTKSDAQVAEKLLIVNDRYRSLRPSLPAPAIRMFDPILDGAIGLVPPETRPAGLTPITSQSVINSVPWLWAAGSFVAGMFACAYLGRQKKTTPNRRRSRRRR